MVVQLSGKLTNMLCIALQGEVTAEVTASFFVSTLCREKFATRRNLGAQNVPTPEVPNHTTVSGFPALGRRMQSPGDDCCVSPGASRAGLPNQYQTLLWCDEPLQGRGIWMPAWRNRTFICDRKYSGARTKLCWHDHRLKELHASSQAVELRQGEISGSYCDEGRPYVSWYQPLPNRSQRSPPRLQSTAQHGYKRPQSYSVIRCKWRTTLFSTFFGHTKLQPSLTLLQSNLGRNHTYSNKVV